MVLCGTSSRLRRTTLLLSVFAIALFAGVTLRLSFCQEEPFELIVPGAQWSTPRGGPEGCPRYASAPAPQNPSSESARALPAAELLCRSLATQPLGVPKLLHQSWKSTRLPAKFEKWSKTCREKHSDWDWVLWTNGDNLELVRRYFPWLEDTFVSLPGEIYRADLARNLYMYLFGGVYADLDTECLRPSSAVFDALHVPATDTLSTPLGNSEQAAKHVAIFGRMGNDTTSQHSIPNAWMAASPGHPFFLMPLVAARAEVARSRSRLATVWYRWPSAEHVTGPIALRNAIQRYKAHGLGREVERLHAAGPFAVAPPQGQQYDLLLLEESWVYPFNWQTAKMRAVCSAEKDGFDAEACKAQLETSEKGSISITYWSHTHKGAEANKKNIEKIDRG